MFPDPSRLAEVSPSELLEAAAKGHLGLDHRFLHALIDRRAESLPAVVNFAARDRTDDAVDLAPELMALFRHLRAPEAVPFFISVLREAPQEVPDEVIEGLVEIGHPALEPLLALYEEELNEGERGEVAFILANLRLRDERVLKLLLRRLEQDPADAVFLLGLYGDPAAKPVLEELSRDAPEGLKNEISEALEQLTRPSDAQAEDESFDIWALYPEEADVPVELLDEDEREELLDHPVAAMRAAAAGSFFNRELTPDLRRRILALAKSDPSPSVRARAWEALTDATEEPEVVEAMLHALRNPGTPVEERGGLLVALAPEADRNIVRTGIVELYGESAGRAKALEAMWRSLHPSFREYFSKHLDDPDIETRRAAIWGIGYYGLKNQLGKLRELFDDEELRSDALFAYSLAVPADISRGRIKGLLSRIENDAHGLAEAEEELVKTALDERLLLAGKKPFFSQQQD